MKALSELLNNKSKVWIKLTPKDYEPFLVFLTQNNCTWINGTKKHTIAVFERHPSYALVEISIDKVVGFIPAMLWCKSNNKKHDIDYLYK